MEKLDPLAYACRVPDTPQPRLLPPPPGTRLSGIVTDWAIVRGIANPGSPEWRTSWDRLVETYRPAMATYVGWRLKVSGRTRVQPDEVEEVIQGFLAWAMAGGVLAKADRTAGPFRAWLQILLKRYVYRYLRGEWRVGAPGGRATVPIEEVADDDLPTASVAEEAQAFDRGWVARLVQVSLERLDERHPPYATVIREIVDASNEDRKPPALANRHLRFHARKAFRSCFEAALRETVASDADVAVEWAELARWLP